MFRQCFIGRQMSWKACVFSNLPAGVIAPAGAVEPKNDY